MTPNQKKTKTDPSLHSIEISNPFDTHSQIRADENLKENSTGTLCSPPSEAFLLVKKVPKPPAKIPDPRAPFTIDPAPGLIIASKYHLEYAIGSGGMGTIWAARHIELDSPVAIKLMSSAYASSQSERNRFKREARAAAQLRSRHVVAVLDFGIDRETPYIVMEKLDGEDLSSRLEQCGSMPVQQAAGLSTPIASALELAHAKGIIHRDLKPENIFLAKVPGERNEVLKVLDFGLSKELKPSFDYDRTSTGVTMGTPAYMSPEQIEDAGKVDHRTDLWSLAVILFKLLTGRPPFTGSEAMKIMVAVLEDPIPKPSSFAPYLDPQIDRFFERALQRNPAHRFQSAQEMDAAFQKVASRCAVPPYAHPAEPKSGKAMELSSSDFIAIDISEVTDWSAKPK